MAINLNVSKHFLLHTQQIDRIEMMQVIGYSFITHPFIHLIKFAMGENDIIEMRV